MSLRRTFSTSADDFYLDRRRWMQIGSLGWLTAALPPSLGLRTAAAGERAARPAGAIQSCIVVFHYGGPSQFETYDPKPEAPREIRGEYATISTAVPGIAVGEYLPRVAQIMNRLAIVRSMHHPMRNHNSAAAEMLTGRTPAGGDLELLADEVRSFPTFGSLLSYALGGRAHALPYVALPYTIYNVVQLPGQTPGFLGGATIASKCRATPTAPIFGSPRWIRLQAVARKIFSLARICCITSTSCHRRARPRKCELIKSARCSLSPPTRCATAST